MEKIIFFGLVIPIFGFVLYLGVTAIMKGSNAKASNKLIEKEKEEQENIQNDTDDLDRLSTELNKLNLLLKDGVLTQEEFEKAKKKNIRKLSIFI